jgi:hypothetical protein
MGVELEGGSISNGLYIIGAAACNAGSAGTADTAAGAAAAAAAGVASAGAGVAAAAGTVAIVEQNSNEAGSMDYSRRPQCTEMSILGPQIIMLRCLQWIRVQLHSAPCLLPVLLSFFEMSELRSRARTPLQRYHSPASVALSRVPRADLCAALPALHLFNCAVAFCSELI